MKKRMSTRALQANAQNARKSRGPKNTTFTSQNARKHGLLAARLWFKSEQEREEFHNLTSGLEQELQPAGPLQSEIVNRIATCLWKLAAADELETAELANRGKNARAILKSLTSSYDGESQPLFDLAQGNSAEAQLGWQCEELVIRSGKRELQEEKEEDGDLNGDSKQMQIEAKLVSSFESILRYRASIQRELFQSIRALRSLQGEKE